MVKGPVKSGIIALETGCSCFVLVVGSFPTTREAQHGKPGTRSARRDFAGVRLDHGALDHVDLT
jgi:hypothetical protein